MFEMAWRDEPVDLDAWIVDYAHHRYGRDQRRRRAAWAILDDTVYSGAASHALDHRPRADAASRPRRRAVRQRADWPRPGGTCSRAADELGDVDAYRFDLVNVARQVLVEPCGRAAPRGRRRRIGPSDAEAFEQASDAFLQLIRDLDELLATRRGIPAGPLAGRRQALGRRPTPSGHDWSGTPGAC